MPFKIRLNKINPAPALLSFFIIGVGILRLRFLGIPLERDEGGFAYIASQILEGIPPYVSGYDFKPPGLYITYAAFIGLFGQTSWAVHAGLALFSAGSMLLIYLLGKKILGETTGLLSCLFFGIMSTGAGLLGFAAHATHFVVFWMLLGSWLAVKYREKNKIALLLMAGLSFGVSSLMKQPGYVFTLFGLLLLTSNGKGRAGKRFRDLVTFSAGFLIPYLPIFAWYYLEGAIDKLIFWNFVYGLEFTGFMNPGDAVDELFSSFAKILRDFPLLWAAAALGFLAILFGRGFKGNRVIASGFVIISAAAVSLGFHYRLHYFVLLLPAASMLGAFFIVFISEKLSLAFAPRSGLLIPLLMALLLTGYGLTMNHSYYFTEPPDHICRRIYHPNLFADSKAVAEFIRARTGEVDKVAVLGSEPQIFFYSGRKSATPYLFAYFLMEPHAHALEMQREMAGQIEAERPKIVFYLNHPISWTVWKNSSLFIFDWAQRYLDQNYHLAGVVDAISKDSSVVIFNEEEAVNYFGKNGAMGLIFERNR